LNGRAPGEEYRRFAAGDAAIRDRLTKLALSRGIEHASVTRQVRELGGPSLTVYEYRLVGTERSISLRGRDVRLASEPDTMRRYIEPRLKAVFEDIWWRKSIVLMAARARDEEDASKG
jgi:hypothetical protein